MYSSTALLHAHIVTSTQDLSIFAHETRSDGNATFSSTFLGLLQSDLETFIVC